jgi:hypothetical protein
VVPHCDDDGVFSVRRTQHVHHTRAAYRKVATRPFGLQESSYRRKRHPMRRSRIRSHTAVAHSDNSNTNCPAQASSASTPRYRPSAKPACQPVSQSPGLRQPGSQVGVGQAGVGQEESVRQAAKQSGSQEVRKSGSQEVRKSGSQEVRKSGSQEVRKFARHQSITATFDSASFQHRSGTTLRSETHQSPERLHRVRQHPLRCHGEQLSGRQLKPQPMLQAPVNM